MNWFLTSDVGLPTPPVNNPRKNYLTWNGVRLRVCYTDRTSRGKAIWRDNTTHQVPRPAPTQYAEITDPVVIPVFLWPRAKAA